MNANAAMWPTHQTYAAERARALCNAMHFSTRVRTRRDRAKIYSHIIRTMTERVV